jgi:hypothetical protein
MLDKYQLGELKSKGYLRVPDYLDHNEISDMMNLMYCWRNDYYDDENLKRRVAYLSDSSSTRISNAYMVSNGNSPLPHIESEDETLNSLIDDYQFILAQMSSKPDTNPSDTRLMLNMQEYKSKSKPVPWHFDGEYLDFNSDDVKDKLEVIQALVPQYVVVYTLYNDNKYGTKIKNIISKKEQLIKSKGGDMLIFDNTAFLHSVPELAKSRAMFGFRNFDYQPKLYSQQYDPDSTATINDCFSGYSKSISTLEAENILKDFNRDWELEFSNKMVAKF